MIPQPQMIALVQCYIKIRKDLDINIIIRDKRDYFLLETAYKIAVSWMRNNNVKITTI
jgi:hypothetical protein